MKRTLVFTAIGAAAFISLLALWIGSAARIRETKETTERLLDEIARQEQIITILEQNARIADRDSAEIRTHLRLPTVQYLLPPPSSGSGHADESGAEDTSRYFRALDFLMERAESEEFRGVVSSFLNGSEMGEILKRYGLSLAADESGFHLRNSERTLFSIMLKGKSLIVTDAFMLSGEREIPLDAGKFSEYLSKTMGSILEESARRTALSRAFLDLPRLPRLQAALKAKQLVLSPPDRPGDPLVIRTKEKALVTVAYAEEIPAFLVNGNSRKTFEDATESILAIVDACDPRPVRVVEQERSVSEIEGLAEDPAFMAFLEKKGCRLEFDYREDNDYYYFDIRGSKGEKIGSFAVLKHDGVIYLMNSEDIVITSLRTMDLPTETKGEDRDLSSLMDQPYIPVADEGTTNFLLCGAHEKDTDTIMIMHADPVKDSLTLISIPRDLFYHGRKINTIYKKYGPYRLMSELSEMTGLRIDRYVVIDMYAFIDVVNILGGVDITLTEDLIDPTYKIRINGQWSSLYYEKGNHHLDGLAALRVARSRNYSSDFDRARRQQMIIGAIKEKLLGLTITDMKIYSKLVGSLLTYVDTNLSLLEIMSYTAKFRTAEIRSDYVIDTSNILYHTYANVYLLPETELERQNDEDFDRGAWILIPVDDNWSLIPAYIQRILRQP